MLKKAAPSPGADGEDTIAVVKSAIDQTLRLAGSALALLRTELRLARSSAFVLVWLSFALVFLGVLWLMRGCWHDLALPRTRRVLADLRATDARQPEPRGSTP